MGLVTETNAQYYSGQKRYGSKNNMANLGSDLVFKNPNFNSEIISAFTNTGEQVLSASNYTIYYKPEARVTSLTLLEVFEDPVFTIGDIFDISGFITSDENSNGAGLRIIITSEFGQADVYVAGQGYLDGDKAYVEQDFIPGGLATYRMNVTEGGSYEALPESLSYVVDGDIHLRDPRNGGYIGDFYIELKQNTIEENYGSYSYISLDDIINNFIVGYVGVGKILPSASRTDIMFHAKRGLQEFSYDTLKSIKSQELTIPPSLSLPLPQDYVNYVKISWVDENGAKHIIYPTRVTSNPIDLLIQDDEGIPTQNWNEENNEAAQSLTEDKWASQPKVKKEKHGNFNTRLGERYGLQPEEAQVNGKFTINERTGSLSFTSDLVGKLVIVEYISDGLAFDEDTKVPKMAEQAMYMHIAHAILSTRTNVPEYVINRYKKEKSTALRTAKIRLSNIKLEEISQVFRNKSKWIKH